MKTRILGKANSLTVSAVGMGCMGFSHGYGAAPERGEAIRLIRLAHELGSNFFDTAEGYGTGHNETLVGEALKPVRKKVVIATKLHIPDLNGKSVSETVKEHLRASMKRLQTDHIDLYYWHRVNPAVSLEEVAETMGKLIKEGDIGGWGLSQITEEQLRLAHSVTPLTAVQSEYSMMERMFEKDVIPACEELGVGFVPFSPLGAGFLSGKYSAKEHYSGDDVRRVITRFALENVSANQPLLELLLKFANEKNATSAQIALAWMLHKNDFIVPIPGMRKEDRVRENLGSAGVKLTAEEFSSLEKSLSEIEIYGNRTDEDIAKLHDMD
ncbi:MAG: aldo/keto reductase [Oscillospiraceae bacterium]|nr:aldo/keto reductase [Oscillospiraceae bacterium]